MMKKVINLVIVFLLLTLSVQSQERIPFWNEVQALRQKDSVQFPAAGQLLFIGSSSFTMWKDVQDYFPGYKILNRAFGGSTLVDLIRFRYDVIYPYQPKQIIIYCVEIYQRTFSICFYETKPEPGTSDVQVCRG